MSRVVFRTAQFENISISSLPLFFSSAGNWQRSTVPATSCFVPTLLHVRNTWNWIKASSLENKLKLILRFKVNLLFLVVYNIASLRSCWRSRYNVHHILILLVCCTFWWDIFFVNRCVSTERQFLTDFVAGAESTAGGRLARWLAPTPHVEPSKCELKAPALPVRPSARVTIPIIVRDQYGENVSSPALKVEVSVIL